jgi:hypothetical protein
MVDLIQLTHIWPVLTISLDEFALRVIKKREHLRNSSKEKRESET